MHILLFVCLSTCLHPLPSLALEECIQEDLSTPPEIVLDLGTAISLALNNNRQLKNSFDLTINSKYQVDNAYAEFDIDIAPAGDVGCVGGGDAGRGATFGAGLNINKKIPFGTTFSVNPMIAKTNKYFFSNIRTVITQPLLRGFGKDYNLSPARSAEFGLRSSMRAYFIAQCQVVLRTCTSLYEIVKAQRSVLLSEQSHMRVKHFFHAAKLKAKIGLTDPLDVYRAEMEMRQAEDSLKTAQEKKEEAEDTLRDLLALPLHVPIKLHLPIVYSPLSVPLDEAIKTALDNRLEVEQAKDHRGEGKRLSRVAKSRLWPELNLVFNYSNCGQDQFFTRCWNWGCRESTWGVGLTTSQFDYGIEKQAYEQTIRNIEAAGRAYEQIVSNITLEVKKAIRHLERTRQRIDLQQEQIHSSEGELKLAQIKFTRGMGNNFDLIQAEKSLRNAQLNHWNALIDYMVGEIQLRAAVGLLLEKPNL